MITALLISWGLALLFLALHEFLFLSPMNRISRIFSSLAAFVPFLGAIWQFAVLIVYCNSYQTYHGDYQFDKDGKQIIRVDNDLDHTVIRDTKVARWLFNEMPWKYIDNDKRNCMNQK